MFCVVFAKSDTTGGLHVFRLASRWHALPRPGPFTIGRTQVSSRLQKGLMRLQCAHTHDADAVLSAFRNELLQMLARLIAACCKHHFRGRQLACLRSATLFKPILNFFAQSRNHPVQSSRMHHLIRRMWSANWHVVRGSTFQTIPISVPSPTSDCPRSLPT